MKSIFVTAAAMIGLAGGAMACPNFNAPPAASYQATGQQMYQERTFDVVAGGENYIWNCSNVRPGTDTGAGYFTTAPDFSFQISGMSRYQLVISMVSEAGCDAALLINTSSANWYYDDDDNGNLDPRIVLTRPVDGRIDIWAGTYDGEYCNARLSMETFDR